jgi:predicted nuclease of restriction endonuclease-like (RecB) superfamily
MHQFWDAYQDDPKLSTLLRELPGAAHLHILAKTWRSEERQFYIRTSVSQRWPVREVARQVDGALFERENLHPPKLSTALRGLHPAAEAVFRDAYVVDFFRAARRSPGGRSTREPAA